MKSRLYSIGIAIPLMLGLSGCGDEVATVAAVSPPVPATPSTDNPVKPAKPVEEFITSSMPDTFTIPHNTCAQGESLQTLKKADPLAGLKH